MRSGMLRGIDRRVSRIGMGTFGFATRRRSFALLDALREGGGNLVDGAWSYGDGASDELLGAWLAERGVREEMVLVQKLGTRQGRPVPELVEPQLLQSLARLRVEHVDVVVAHYDDPSVPVAEVVDALWSQVAAGRALGWGVSNWTRGRLDELSGYVERAGIAPPAAVTSQFSLARWVERPWPVSRAVGEDERRWLARTGMALLAWGSRAHGFFARAAPGELGDEQLVRVWYGDANFARLARAQQIGRARGRSAADIALAWVLHQDFPTFALVGPVDAPDLRLALAAAGLELSADELRLLDELPTDLVNG